MSDSEKGFMRQLLRLLLSPRETFEGINESELVKSVAIVLVIAVLSAWASMLYFIKTDTNLLGLSTDIGQSTMFHPGAQGTGGFDLETIKRRIAPFESIASGIGIVVFPKIVLFACPSKE